MGKKKSKVPQKPAEPVKIKTRPGSPSQPAPPSELKELTTKQALLITLLFAAASYIFSYFYTSFYQGEEGAQYMNALGFWQYPETILGNWPKTGWKIIYAPIVLFGKQGVLIANCLFAAFTAFFTYKTASIIIKRKSVLPMFLLFSQSLWFLLSFKFFSEILTAFLLSIAIYFYYRNKFVLFSIFISYVLLLRQEFIFIVPFFAIIFLKKKNWLAFLALGLFPLLYNIWGWAITGDIMYAVHESQRTAELYKNSYPRQGFDHYFIMSGTVFNYIIITLVVAYLSQIIFRQDKKVEFPLLVIGLGYFLLHCLFNFQAFPILTSTGGNLRYMLVVSPVMALLASKAIDNFQFVSKRLMALTLLVPLFFVVAAKMTFSHNWVGMDTTNEERNFIPLLFCGATILLITVFRSQKNLVLSISGLCILSLLLTIKSKELCCDENFEQKKIADYIKEEKLDGKPIYQNLALFNFFYGKNAWDFPAGNIGMNGDSVIDKAPKGSIVIWDSHYATKYGKVELDYFNNRLANFKKLKEFRSEDNAFMALVLEKLVGPDPPVK